MMLTTILKSFDRFEIIACTSSSITFSLTGFSLLAIPISAATGCRLSLSKMVEIVLQQYHMHEKMRKMNKLLNHLVDIWEKLARQSKY